MEGFLIFLGGVWAMATLFLLGIGVLDQAADGDFKTAMICALIWNAATIVAVIVATLAMYIVSLQDELKEAQNVR